MRLMILPLLCLLHAACTSPPAVDMEAGEALVEQARELECRRQTLRRQTDDLWNAVSDSLSANLPGTMEADERRNMINIRNADLIRMFKVYPTLDTGIHGLVDRAESRDSALAVDIRNLEARQQEHDRAEQAFLMELEKTDQASYEQWRERLATARREACAQ